MLRFAVIAYCAENLGDDLFVQLLADRYSGCEIALLSASDKSLGHLRQIRGLSAIDLPTFKSTAGDYDALIVLGGSMFQQRPGWVRSWAAYARRFRIAKRAGVPIFVIGASFGPYSTVRYPQAFRLLFRQCEWMSFRDKASASLFGALSATRWFPDLAFAYDVAEIPRPIVGGSGPIGISIMEFGEGKNLAGYTRAMGQLVAALGKTRQVKIFCFQDTSAISDSRAAEAAMEIAAPEARNVQICRYSDFGLDGILGEVASCSMVVSTRFHAMVTAVVLGRPVVSVGYHPKVAATVDALGLAIPVLDFGEIADTAAMLEAIARSEASDAPDVSGLAAEARRHFEGLDRLLGAS